MPQPVKRATNRDMSHLAIDWPALLEDAAAIVAGYDTLVTLRQLFYRLVAAERLANTTNAYKLLSRHTAEARRAGLFPELMDRGRLIHRYTSFTDPAVAKQWLKAIYRVDRTRGQRYSVYLATEKAGIVAQLEQWFGDLGVPILALGGYSSWSYKRDTIADVEKAKRPAVLLYSGDHDPSGEDIDRDFIAQTDCWIEVRRVALTAAQVTEYNLPPQPGKDTDSRAARFIKRHGRLVQVELDALPPDTLRALFTEALAEFWDDGAYEAALAKEDADRQTLG